VALLEGLGGGVAKSIAGRLERFDLLPKGGKGCGLACGIAADGLDDTYEDEKSSHDRDKQNGDNYENNAYTCHDFPFNGESIIVCGCCKVKDDKSKGRPVHGEGRILIEAGERKGYNDHA
jgi:hypothetical protein